MNRSRLDLYLSKFTGDELTLVPSECQRPWACSCSIGNPACGLTPEEAQLNFVKYYRDKADHYAELTPEQFMTELGFYTYQK